MSAAKVYGDPAAIFARSVLPRTTVTIEGCWIFNGATISTGYGSVGAGKKGRSITTHRLSVLASGREIPEGMTVDHMCHDSHTCQEGKSCEHRRCVNPDHLAILTSAENFARVFESNVCRKGHPLTLRAKGGKRQCLTCRRAYAAELRARLKSAS